MILNESLLDLGIFLSSLLQTSVEELLGYLELFLNLHGLDGFFGHAGIVLEFERLHLTLGHCTGALEVDMAVAHGADKAAHRVYVFVIC